MKSKLKFKLNFSKDLFTSTPPQTKQATQNDSEQPIPDNVDEEDEWDFLDSGEDVNKWERERCIELFR